MVNDQMTKLRPDPATPGVDLVLVEPDESHEAEYLAMMDEWTSYGGRLNPALLCKPEGASYSDWLESVRALRDPAKVPEDSVPQTFYFLMIRGASRILGASVIRHYLNVQLLYTGGHIGGGIRPTERRRGYSTAMLGLSLQKCREMGLTRVLLTCDSDNVGSAKSIIANGGVLENEVPKPNGALMSRYWIEL